MTTIDKIYGLVLSGGKSTRMGKDKGKITYHGVPQREYIYKLLDEVCDETFISIRKDQEKELSKDFQVLVDDDVYKGPYNGILTAHAKHPNVAWLVLACDLPLINKPALEQLIAARDAIWEAAGLKASVAYMNSQQGSCPRKFLINTDTNLVFPTDENVLLNANSESDYREAIKIVDQ